MSSGPYPSDEKVIRAKYHSPSRLEESSYYMHYLTQEDRRREALAHDGLHGLAKILRWEIEPCPAFLPPAIQGCFYSPTANLVLVSWRKSISLRRLIGAAREIRVDILLIEPVSCNRQVPIVRVSLIRCRDGDIFLYRSLELWTSDIEGSVWLIPDPGDRDAERVCFDLQRNQLVAQEQMPYTSLQSRDLGLLIGAIRWKATIGGHLI